MAFKMKGSAFKLGNVATKSALKDQKAGQRKRDIEAHMGEDHQHNWKETTPETVYPELYPDSEGSKNYLFEKDQKRLNEKRKVQEQGKKIDKGTLPMKSPMMQASTCAICGGTEEQHNVGQWNESDHKYKMGQAEAVADSKNKRNVEMETQKAELIKKHGSWDAAVAANEKKIKDNTNKSTTRYLTTKP